MEDLDLSLIVCLLAILFCIISIFVLLIRSIKNTIYKMRLMHGSRSKWKLTLN